MTKLRRATVDDLATLAYIHKVSYSRRHLTALLPDEVLKSYYSYFLDEGTEIWLAIDDCVHYKDGIEPSERVLGFAVFGFGIPEKIEIFKQKNRSDILSVLLRHPLKATKKVLGILLSRLDKKKVHKPTDFLLLSIAVAKPSRGVGRCLLNAMLEIANQNECKAVGLYVNSDNLSAINVYFFTGFVIVDAQGGQFYMEKSFR